MAIVEADRGAGFVSPNPLVGCVILDRHGEFLAKGYHARVGEAHAEVAALREVRDPARLEGAHVIVTLEPCAHEGRTPSCAKALAKLPIARVTFGLVDPNPLVSGQGAAILRQAGKVVEQFVGLETELNELAEIFLLNMRLKRPFVALKAASTLDGKIARPDGTSKWITGEAARAEVHRLRGRYDAVVVGAGTFLSDDPRLDARDARYQGRRSRVVLLDEDGRTIAKLAGSNLLKVRAPEDLTVVTRALTKPPSGVRLLHLLAGEGVAELLAKLRADGIHSLFIEGGAGVYASFLNAGMVDRLYLFLGTPIFGAGLSWTEGFAGEPRRWRNVRLKTFGDDVCLTATPD